MTEHDEQQWANGNRAAWQRMLSTCIHELGVDDPVAGQAAWILEREATVACLRRICEEWGDDDWPADLHLADVIEKHLERHLEAKDA